MKIFDLVEMRYNSFLLKMQSYLSKTLSQVNETFGPNTIFGQLLNVLTSVVENMMLYVEDALIEQNKYTAQRKKSIYGLAVLSGYNPSLGKAAGCNIKLNFLPTNTEAVNIVINNHTKIACNQNGLIYNLILPQEAIVIDINTDISTKYIYCVEGTFESQTFVSEGGQLYTKNITFPGDIDIDYLEVKVNGEIWSRSESIYDMTADGKEYVAKTSINKGIDLIFGNDQYGRTLSSGDTVEVTYLLHSGEIGNINENDDCDFTFQDVIYNIKGDEIDGNEVFNISLVEKDGISSGTYSETTEQVREMIGLNSRALVLADPKNYKTFLNKFSFVGYNRTWSEEGSLIVNSLILKNYKQLIDAGDDYFNLSESDFILSSQQKESIINCISNSGQQLAGVSFNIFDPEICKYAVYIYLKLKTTIQDKTYITNKIRTLIGEFFSDLGSDIFIPKSDIIHLLKENIEEIDSVDLYFLSQLNEEALINKKYTNKIYNYNIATGTYDIKEETVYLYGTEDPGVGLDSHGNIYLNNNTQYPALMGGWKFISSSSSQEIQYTQVIDPVTIIYE